jgi:hypothetical protein
VAGGAVAVDMRRPSRRQLLAWCLTAAGAAALFLGWWGASGTAVTAKQVPYVVSGGLTGVCLLVLAAACFASDDVRRSLGRVTDLERQVDALYRLLTVPDGQPEQDDADLVALAGGSSYHRSGCRLVTGKDTAKVVTPRSVRTRSLTACRVCDPPELPAT